MLMVFPLFFLFSTIWTVNALCSYSICYVFKPLIYYSWMVNKMSNLAQK